MKDSTNKKRNLPDTEDETFNTEEAKALDGFLGAAIGAIGGATMGPPGAIAGALAGGVIDGEPGETADNVTPTDEPVSDPKEKAKDIKDKASEVIEEAKQQVKHKVQKVLRDGVQTGGETLDGSPDRRGITEKIADAVTGDKIDDKSGKRLK